jgi:hypothetical protein
MHSKKFKAGLLALVALTCVWISPAQVTGGPGGACQPYRNGAVTTAVTVKSATGNLYAWFIYNPNASACSLDLFNTTSPTLGTTVPVLSLMVPPTSAANIAPGAAAWANFSTAIGAAAVTSPGGASTCATGMTVDLAISQ